MSASIAYVLIAFFAGIAVGLRSQSQKLAALGYAKWKLECRIVELEKKQQADQ
jgi:hypothetical protein